jgi:HAD domain in Swiss Army Knife RNA repair proteins
MKALQTLHKPLLFLDIDGVISLFGWGSAERPDGSFHAIDGIPHFLSAGAAAHLHALAEHFDPVWCSGWEEKANEHLPHLLGLPGPYPFLSFDAVGPGGAHWKLEAIERHAGERPLAWIDDSLSDDCHRWATARAAPTLLVPTDPASGMTAREVAALVAWASALQPGATVS